MEKFTFSEKEKFLLAIKEHGFNVLDNLNLLQSYLPSRSTNEIKYAIEKYVQKGRDWCNKNNYKESFDSIEDLENWCSVVSSIVPATSKKDDYSNILKDVFIEISESSSNHSNSASYQLIYKFLSEILSGKCPLKLPTQEAHILFSLFNDLELLFLKNEFQEEVNFLKSGEWWEKEIFSNEVNQSAILLPLVDQASSQSSQDSVLSFLDLPKIRKIRECLNPLNIPIDLLVQSHSVIKKSLNNSTN